MYCVADVMTPRPVTLQESDDLGLADTVMKLGRLRHLPVTRQGLVIGLVTHRDLIKALAERGPLQRNATRAGEVMTRGVTCVEPATPLRKALKLMLRNKFGCLPVVEEGRLVGIVTEADMVRFAAHVVAELDRIERSAVALTLR